MNPQRQDGRSRCVGAATEGAVCQWHSQHGPKRGGNQRSIWEFRQVNCKGLYTAPHSE